jgi:hypothetical protein
MMAIYIAETLQPTRVRSSSLGLGIKKIRRQIGRPAISQFELKRKENICIQVLECAEGFDSTNL